MSKGERLPEPEYTPVPNGEYEYELSGDYCLDVDTLPDFELTTTLGAPRVIARLASNKLTILKGYRWDGCSGPTIDSPNTRAPCLVHDALCQMLNRGQKSRELGPFTKAHSKRVHLQFHRHLRRNGMNRIRSLFWLRAVQLAWSPYD